MNSPPSHVTQNVMSPLTNTDVHKFSKKSKSHLKTLDPRRVEWSKFHSEDPQVFGAAEQKSVARNLRTYAITTNYWRLCLAHVKSVKT